jgi:hypothetical protein
VVAIGDSLSDSSEAEYSAVCSALANLYREHSYIIQDYSLIRAEICKSRLQDFTPKVGECREACEEVKNRFLDALEQLRAVSVMFADAAVESDGGGTDLGISATLMSCSEELKKLHVAAKEQMNRFHMVMSSELGVQGSPLAPTSNSGVALDASVIDFFLCYSILFSKLFLTYLQCCSQFTVCCFICRYTQSRVNML